MLEHLEAILELRRKRGLFIEERHAAGWKWGHSLRFPHESCWDFQLSAEAFRRMHESAQQ
jgi:hypothetical protein